MSVTQAKSAWDAVRQAWKDAHLVPLWESPTAHKPPPAPVPAHLWAWTSLRPLLAHAIEAASPAIVERRVLSLVSPASRSAEDEATTRNLSAAMQILLPGEAAKPHRHSMSALRFVLEGEGAETVVDGKPCPMHMFDLILTPGWCWHEHIHRGDAPVIWLDVLDVPLHLYLGTAAFQPGPALPMPATVADAAFASANMLPDTIMPAVMPTGMPTSNHSPVFRYTYEAAARAVAAAPKRPDGTRQVRYVNPLTGGAPMGLMDCRLVQIDPGARTIPTRSNSNAICLVVEGSGQSQVGDRLLEWAPRDVFTLPQHQFVSHETGETARLFVTSDRELLARLGLLRDEMGEGA